MHLVAGILLGAPTCLHCSRPTQGPQRCQCATGITDRRGRRHDHGEVLFTPRRAAA